MPQNSWSARRERQYGHIKESLIERGKPESLAEEIADLMINRHGETANCDSEPLLDQ